MNNQRNIMKNGILRKMQFNNTLKVKNRQVKIHFCTFSIIAPLEEDTMLQLLLTSMQIKNRDLTDRK